MRSGRQSLRAARGAFAAAALLSLLARSALGQCDASIKAAPGDIGYRDRGYACEGMFIGLQSAPHGVHVVSFVRGALRYHLGIDSIVDVGVGDVGSAVRPSVRVIGRARIPNLHWAFDGVVQPNSRLAWDLGKVVKRQGLGSESVGMHGVATRATGLGAPIFVPLDVGHSHAGDSLELIVRAPAAAELCWMKMEKTEIQSTQGCRSPWALAKSAPEGNPDGYFRIALPTPPAGEARLALKWRPLGGMASGQRRFGEPVYLTFLSPK